MTTQNTSEKLKTILKNMQYNTLHESFYIEWSIMAKFWIKTIQTKSNSNKVKVIKELHARTYNTTYQRHVINKLYVLPVKMLIIEIQIYFCKIMQTYSNLKCFNKIY